jgi:quercetin dioxygenase-like cupin family protein
LASTFESEIKLRAERLSAIELALAADWTGPPLHHHAFDEAFYVLEGELTFQLGDERRTAGPGELVFAPGGAVHTLGNLSGAPARYLLICAPPGFERRFMAEPDGPLPEVTVVGPPLARDG